MVKRGVNEHGLLRLAEHFRGSGHILRLIEYMDVGNTNGWRMDDVVPRSRDRRRRSAPRWPIEPVDRNYRGEVANRYRYVDGGGEIGIIASVTQPFCARLHTGPALGRGQAVHLPFRQPRPRPAKTASRGR